MAATAHLGAQFHRLTGRHKHDHVCKPKEKKDRPKFSGNPGDTKTMKVEAGKGLLNPPSVHPHRARAGHTARRAH
jgi:hypothetical protein